MFEQNKDAIESLVEYVPQYNPYYDIDGLVGKFVSSPITQASDDDLVRIVDILIRSAVFSPLNEDAEDFVKSGDSMHSIIKHSFSVLNQILADTNVRAISTLNGYEIVLVDKVVETYHNRYR